MANAIEAVIPPVWLVCGGTMLPAVRQMNSSPGSVCMRIAVSIRLSEQVMNSASGLRPIARRSNNSAFSGKTSRWNLATPWAKLGIADPFTGILVGRLGAPQGAHALDVFGFAQAVADIDEGKGVEDPGGKLGMGEALEMAAPVASLRNQSVRPQQRQMLREPGGWQGQRSGKLSASPLSRAQFLDQAQAICMGEQPHQVGKVGRVDHPAGYDPSS